MTAEMIFRNWQLWPLGILTHGSQGASEKGMLLDFFAHSFSKIVLNAEETDFT